MYSKVTQLLVYSDVVIQYIVYKYIYIIFFRFFSIIDYYMIQNTAPCVIQLELTVHLYSTEYLIQI